MIEPTPQMDDEIGTRARSAWTGHTLHLANIQEIFNENRELIAFLSGRLKYLG